MNGLEKRVERLEEVLGSKTGVRFLIQSQDAEKAAAELERAKQEVGPNGVLFVISNAGAT